MRASCGCEAPVHPKALPIPPVFPCPGFLLQDSPAGDASVQALPVQNPDFNLGHIQPTAVLRRVVNLQPLSDAPGL